MKSLKRYKKLSTLLKVSMEDAAKVEKSKKYRFDMDTWHSPEKGKCSVCQAGATMAMRLGVPFTQVGFGDFDDETSRRLSALNELRLGIVSQAARRIGLRWGAKAEKLFPGGYTPYGTFGDSYTPAYRAAMKRLILDLKKAGL